MTVNGVFSSYTIEQTNWWKSFVRWVKGEFSTSPIVDEPWYSNFFSTQGQPDLNYWKIGYASGDIIGRMMVDLYE